MALQSGAVEKLSYSQSSSSQARRSPFPVLNPKEVHSVKSSWYTFSVFHMVHMFKLKRVNKSIPPTHTHTHTHPHSHVLLDFPFCNIFCVILCIKAIRRSLSSHPISFARRGSFKIEVYLTFPPHRRRNQFLHFPKLNLIDIKSKPVLPFQPKIVCIRPEYSPSLTSLAVTFIQSFQWFSDPSVQSIVTSNAIAERVNGS